MGRGSEQLRKELKLGNRNEMRTQARSEMLQKCEPATGPVWGSSVSSHTPTLARPPSAIRKELSQSVITVLCKMEITTVASYHSLILCVPRDNQYAVADVRHCGWQMSITRIPLSWSSSGRHKHGF